MGCITSQRTHCTPVELLRKCDICHEIYDAGNVELWARLLLHESTPNIGMQYCYPCWLRRENVRLGRGSMAMDSFRRACRMSGQEPYAFLEKFRPKAWVKRKRRSDISFWESLWCEVNND